MKKNKEPPTLKFFEIGIGDKPANPEALIEDMTTIAKGLKEEDSFKSKCTTEQKSMSGELFSKICPKQKTEPCEK